MTLLHPFTHTERPTSATVRELERHGLDRFPGVALLSLPGRVRVDMCAACVELDGGEHLARLLEGRPENERAALNYGDDAAKAAGACTGHRERHPQA